MDNVSQKDLRDQIISKLSHNLGIIPEDATQEHYYKALVLVLRDVLSEHYTRFKRECISKGKKQIYYMCMEFLLGRSLKNNIFNLGLESTIREALRPLNVELESLYDQEPDAGLGNGGLGRLAACFLDSLSTQGYPAMGYSLRYEYGIFKQKLVEGWQTELPDFWLDKGSIWFQPHYEKSVRVLFNGNVEEKWNDGYHCVNIKDATEVIAVPYDMMIAGYGGKGVSQLRVWAARSEEFDMGSFNNGDYVRAVERKAMSEVITKVLYPGDNHPEGKSLRLSQQYFLVSATVQDIVRQHLHRYKTLDDLPDTVAIHLNDTHPVLAIPEFMRIMLDECGYRWDVAWDLVTRTIAYTNHTVMTEALECWGEEMFKAKLPRIYQIVQEINRRFCDQMHTQGVDPYKIGRMAIINEGFVNMPNLAVVACHSVNGVSRLHSDILKQTVFSDFYSVMPEKFKSVTNGISYRRWLNQSNPSLAGLITELIGDQYIVRAKELDGLRAYVNDNSVLQSIEKIKRYNKIQMANYIKLRTGITVDPNSVFDVQIKRLHEYKRQHLNAMHILSQYQYLRKNPNADFVPKTYIFGAKAAPGYYFAKQIIRFIVKLSELINKDTSVRDKLRVVFMEGYDVTLAEKLIPASEISEQISLAGTEASGTSNMKFMINGAITVGTLDGANVEMYELLGPDNIIIFGMKASEVQSMRDAGYKPMTYYSNNMVIKLAIDEMRLGFSGVKFDDIVNSLVTVDPYMVLADFADYALAQQRAGNMYKNKRMWNEASLMNIANAGNFSGDESVREYAEKIWGISPT